MFRHWFLHKSWIYHLHLLGHLDHLLMLFLLDLILTLYHHNMLLRHHNLHSLLWVIILIYIHIIYCSRSIKVQVYNFRLLTVRLLMLLLIMLNLVLHWITHVIFNRLVILTILNTVRNVLVFLICFLFKIWLRFNLKLNGWIPRINGCSHISLSRTRFLLLLNGSSLHHIVVYYWNWSKLTIHTKR